MSASDVTADLERRLGARHRGDGWSLLFGVGNGAGFGNSGWSDALAMSTWPSRGLRLLGFELKSTRSDWLRELDKPRKNAEWQSRCHEWYVVAPKGVVELAEMPSEWGLMVPRGKDGLRIAKRSEMASVSPVSLALVAAVFRGAGNVETRLRDVGLGEIRASIRAELADELARATSAKTAAVSELVELKSALGGRWASMDDLKTRAAALEACETADVLSQVTHALRRVKTVHERLTAAAESLKE